MTMFPPLEPFATGHLHVDGSQTIFWEASGNPEGKPAMYLHGGPGHGIMTSYRLHFDPETHLIVSFEQRGCGRSRPLVNEPGLLAWVDRIAHIPAVLIHGRYDVSSPLEIAWKLHRAWPVSELIVIEDEGHGGEKIAQEVTRAIARFARPSA